MIRLIALDVDGTLVDKHNAEFSEKLLDEIERLMDAGIIFCFATGRQFSNLKAMAGRLADRFYYVSENGAVIYGNTAVHPLLFCREMNRERALEVANTILSQKDCEAVVCGPDMFYLKPKKMTFVERMSHYTGSKNTIVSSYDEIKDPIVLVSGFSPDSSVLRETLSEHCDPAFHYAVSGPTWVDTSNYDKGQGICRLCEYLGIRLEEVAAFGDNWNDEQILSIVGHPYLRCTASEELRSRGWTVFRNVEDVLKTL